MTPSPLAATFFALLSAVGYGTVGILTTIATREGSPLHVTMAWRFTLAALAMAVAWPRLRRAPLGAALGAFALGGSAFFIQSYCYLQAVAKIGAGPAAVLLYAFPGIVVLLEWLFRGVRPTRLQALVLATTSVGCALTVQAPGGSLSPEGVGLGMVPAFVYGAYLLIGSHFSRVCGPLATALAVSSGAATSYWVFTLVSGDSPLPATPAAWGATVGLALVATVMPMAATFLAMSRLGATNTALISTAEPLVAIILGAVVLGERLGATQLAGGALVMAGAALLALRGRLD
jgi:drug/metabolite transporter (DMT)-like permease